MKILIELKEIASYNILKLSKNLQMNGKNKIRMTGFLGIQKIGLLLLLLMLCLSCKNLETDKSNNIEKKIGNYFEKNCNQIDDCVFPIKDVTNFKWDKFYVFDYGIDKYKIDKIVGLKVNATDNNTRKLVFVLDNKVIYLEQNLSEVDKATEGEVRFEEMDRINYAVYKYDAKFKAVKDGELYKLNCVNCKDF